MQIDFVTWPASGFFKFVCFVVVVVVFLQLCFCFESHLFLLQSNCCCCRCFFFCPRRVTFTWWGCSGLCFFILTNRTCPFLFILFSCLFLFYGPFNCISLHKFSRQLSAFSLCSSSILSALLIFQLYNLSRVKVSFSPDVILCG